MSQQIYKALPIWQEIPEKFKVKIVNLLDFESRFCLRQCSVSDKELVDKCQIIIKSIFVVNTRDDEISVVIRVKHPRAYYFHALPKTTRGDHAVDRSVVEFLGHLGTNCKKFVFDGICNSEMMEKLGKMAQWKNATGICFPHWNILKLTHVLHCNSLRLAMKEFDSKDAKMLIETFIHKKVFKYDSTFFQIYVETSMNVEEVLLENDDDLKPKLTNANEDNYPSIRFQTFSQWFSG
ncbi:hypothetical protein L3Y34_006925 [Caenorhabditis briggsae]|uniref:DUF38 domain-containing protein n=1 Tax=Caenorhabditis briggsae TaxID=6238 RepID=A0AAE9A116_CAEBR|nr:hypothetical protein L3Y34_006925 [Caenorhabditis briggsae]